MTGLNAAVTLSVLSAAITTVIIPSATTGLTVTNTVTNVTGGTALNSIIFIGNSASVSTWAIDGSLTTENAILNLSQMTGLGSQLNLSELNADISTVVLPSSVKRLTVPGTLTNVSSYGLTHINLIGNATTIPTWINDVGFTIQDAVLDLSQLTIQGDLFDLSTITNPDIIQVTVPYNNTATNTMGWTSSNGNTWTRV